MTFDSLYKINLDLVSTKPSSYVLNSFLFWQVIKTAR